MQLNSGLWTVEHLAGTDLRECRYVKHTSNKLLLCNMKLSKRDEKLVRPQQRQSMKLALTKAISALPGPRISISFTVLFSVVLYIYIYIVMALKLVRL